MRLIPSSVQHALGFMPELAARARLGADRADRVRPRVSCLGWLIALALSGVLMMGLATSLFWSVARGQLQEQAAARLADVELMITHAVNDLDRAAAQLTMSCAAGASAVLAEQSLTARMVDYLHWVDPKQSTVCSPLPNRRAQIMNGLEVALEQTAGLRQSIVLGGSQDGLLLGRRLPEAGGYLVGEITAAQLAMRLSLATHDGGRAILHRWDGVVLSDSAGLSDSATPGVGGQYASAVVDWAEQLRIQGSAQSTRYPVSIELQPNPVVVVGAGSRYLLAGALLAGLMTTLLIALINMRLAQRSSFERRLRVAMDRQEFEPVIQPIVDAQSGECRGGEVLVRWRHPCRGLLPPSEFLESAEKLGMVGELTLIIMRRAREQLGVIFAANPSLYVSFNLEAPQLRDPIFMRQFEAIFEEGSLPPERIVIELVEREAVDVQARVALSRLRQRGYRIAIDDFGTGQSSLALLSSIDFDLLKIDRTFVASAGDNEINLPVLDAILGLAARLNVSTVAEGVETPAQHSQLVARGVTSIQGYLVARPMPLAQFGQWLYARAGNPAYATVQQSAAVGAPAAAAVSSDSVRVKPQAVTLPPAAAPVASELPAAPAAPVASAAPAAAPAAPGMSRPVTTAAGEAAAAVDVAAATARADRRRAASSPARAEASRGGLSGLRARTSRIVWQPVLAREDDGLLLV